MDEKTESVYREAVPLWRQIALDSIAAGAIIQSAASVTNWDGKRMVAMTLLARSMSNMAAVVALMDVRQHLEVRVLNRLLFENALTMMALEKDAEAVWEMLNKDHGTSKIRRGELLLKTKGTFTPQQLDATREHMKQFKKGGYLAVADLAEIGGSDEFLKFFAQLSADSMHVSFDSLERHMDINLKEEFCGVLVREPSTAEDDSDTYSHALIPFLSILDAAHRLYGDDVSIKALDQIGLAYQRLAERLQVV